MSRAAEKPKRWIRPLPERVVNKIAAGEVIERPAAVVKELVENSIDAGADRIDIIVEKSGARLIKIVDNGCGIPEEQVEIAFSRHATSKIATFDDLNELYSYGFRGEALPSVASVSRLRMVTRTHDAAHGTEIIYEGGVLQSKKPIAAAPGTTIEVENLFFNTPARRKFLKAESTEARHISRMAMALAIGRFDIGFSYTANGRKIYTVPAQGSVGERVPPLLSPSQRFLTVTGEEGPIRLSGCIGLPDMVQNNRYGQFFFINKRFIGSPTLSHAFVAGYGELIPKGMFPVGALLIEVDPHEVDVNVHPTKAEVRLSREREIHDAVYHLIKETLRQDGIIPTFPLRSGEDEQRPERNGGNRYASHTAQPRLSGQGVIPGVYQSHTIDRERLGEFYRPPEHTQPASEPRLPSGEKVDTETGEVIEEGSAETSISAPAEEGPSQGFRFIGRFANLYLLIEVGEELYVVDQHTAHERVLYEETLRKMANQSMSGQSLLFPAQVELSPEQFAVFEESTEMLNQTGFAVAPFGGRTVNIEATPTVLARKHKSPEKVFLKILDDIASLRKAGQDLTKAMAQSIACRSAVMSGDRLNDQEAVHLLEALLACDDRYSCPHGRPTFVRMTKADLDRQFGRG